MNLQKELRKKKGTIKGLCKLTKYLKKEFGGYCSISVIVKSDFGDKNHLTVVYSVCVSNYRSHSKRFNNWSDVVKYCIQIVNVKLWGG